MPEEVLEAAARSPEQWLPGLRSFFSGSMGRQQTGALREPYSFAAWFLAGSPALPQPVFQKPPYARKGHAVTNIDLDMSKLVLEESCVRSANCVKPCVRSANCVLVHMTHKGCAQTVTTRKWFASSCAGDTHRGCAQTAYVAPLTLPL